ncbi:Uncharacterised protein [uncultured archaeon]|nr:Uncharacterised protein [uncultured archaeon]
MLCCMAMTEGMPFLTIAPATLEKESVAFDIAVWQPLNTISRTSLPARSSASFVPVTFRDLSLPSSSRSTPPFFSSKPP